MDFTCPTTQLQALLQSEAQAVYSDFWQPVTYTPIREPNNPVCIQSAINVKETGVLTNEGDRQRYHREAVLVTSMFNGPFLEEDQFEFQGMTWFLMGSPETNLMNGLQTVHVISKETFEIGEFRRAQ